MRSQNWIVPKQGYVWLLLIAATVMILTTTQTAAQQGNPEVYVDMSVLQGLGDAPAQQPVQLKPPVPRQPQSRLTAPASPAVQETVVPQAPVTAPVQQVIPVTPPPPPPPPVGIVKPSHEAKTVQQAIRGEEVPSQQKPAAIPAPEEVAPAKVQPRPYVSSPPQVPVDLAPKPILKTVEPSSEPLSPVAPPPPVKEVAVEPPPLPVTQEEPAKVVAFPVKTKTKDETSDPSAPNSPSRPVPVRSGIAGNLNDVVPSRPAPDVDPSAPVEAPPVRDLTEGQQDRELLTSKIIKAEPAKKALRADVVPSRKPKIEQDVTQNTRTPAEEPLAAADVPAVTDEPVPEAVADDQPVLQKPPIPPRRPETKQSVSPEVLAELIKKEQEKVQSGGAIDLIDPPPPPGPKGRKNMPAVAAGAVDSEPLSEQIVKLPVEGDPLLDRLLEKDKADLVKTIETLVDQREENKPDGKKEAVKKPDAGSSIFKAEPIQRPYNVYRPEKAKQQRSEEQSKKMLASLSDEVVPRPPQPRSEDEQAYVSLPFKDGVTDLDELTSKEIEAKLLPLLNDNPAWKLQIQAFASPIKDGTSSARKASLARAMAVRSFLLNKGIEATRMDVRALGAESDRDPMDRVDLIVFDPAKKRS